MFSISYLLCTFEFESISSSMLFPYSFTYILQHWILHLHLVYLLPYWLQRKVRLLHMCACVWAPFLLPCDTQNVGHLFRGGPHIFDISLRLFLVSNTLFSALWIQSDLCLQMQLFDDASQERKSFDGNSNLCLFIPSSQQSWNAKDEQN